LLLLPDVCERFCATKNTTGSGIYKVAVEVQVEELHQSIFNIHQCVDFLSHTCTIRRCVKLADCCYEYACFAVAFRCKVKLPCESKTERLWVCRDNLRLKGEKLHDTNVITRLKNKLTHTESKLTWHKEHGEELQKKLSEQAIEKDASTLVIEGLKDKVRELEMVSFVMTDRANRFSEEVKPRSMEVARLTQQRSVQDKELARMLRLVDKLRAGSQRKDTSMQCAPHFWVVLCPANVYLISCRSMPNSKRGGMKFVRGNGECAPRVRELLVQGVRALLRARLSGTLMAICC
jgi:hypothetical protein